MTVNVRNVGGLATPMLVDDLLGSCRQPGANRHHVCDPRFKAMEASGATNIAVEFLNTVFYLTGNIPGGP